MAKNKIYLTINEFKIILLNLDQVCNIMIEKDFEIEVYSKYGKLIFLAVIDSNKEYGWACKSHIIIIK